MAFMILSGLAGSDLVERSSLAPAKRSILKLSSARRVVVSSLKSSLARLRGKPLMEPETSMTKMKSRSGMSCEETSAGGSTWRRKVFSPSP